MDEDGSHDREDGQPVAAGPVVAHFQKVGQRCDPRANVEGAKNSDVMISVKGAIHSKLPYASPLTYPSCANETR